MAAVVFAPEEFKEIYPQFQDFSDARLQYFFDVACTLVDNTERSRIPYDPPAVQVRKTILYTLVCHCCELSIRGGGAVGTIASASEGSVSTSFSVPANPEAYWYNQTQCGALAYQLMAPYIVGGRAYRGCFR